jgi:hypothetical protein
MVGGFALLPDLKQTLVHFVSSDCSNETYPLVDDQYNLGMMIDFGII